MPARKQTPEVVTEEEVVEEITQDETVVEDTPEPQVEEETIEPRKIYIGFAVAGAFARAQAEIGTLTKNAKNTFFKTPAGKPAGYVDLAAITAAVHPVLASHGLAYIQRMERDDTGYSIVSYIQHEDGSSLPESRYPVLTKDQNDPQKFGAGVTYARRYSMMLYLGLAAEDDDGNTAAGNASNVTAVSAPNPRDTATANLRAALKAHNHTTKEAVADALSSRFPDAANVASLTTEQIVQWTNELTNADKPNF
jgi:hypothetical protein